MKYTNLSFINLFRVLAESIALFGEIYKTLITLKSMLGVLQWHSNKLENMSDIQKVAQTTKRNH